MADQQVPDLAALEQAVKDAQAQLEYAQQRLDAARQAQAVPSQPAETVAQPSAPAPTVQPAPTPPTPAAQPAPTPPTPSVQPAPTQPTAPTYYSATQQSYYASPVAYQPYQQAQQSAPGQTSQPSQVYYQQPSTSYAVVTPQAAPLPKDHIVAGLLAIFLGCLGIHKFYLGYNTAGLIMLGISIVGGLLTLTFATGVMALIGLIEGIIYLSKSQYDFEQTYVVHKKEWF